MKPYLASEIKSGKRLNPKPRPAPRVYQRQHDLLDEDKDQPHEFLMFVVACFVSITFATLCVAIA
jgi:hypothetical protein